MTVVASFLQPGKALVAADTWRVIVDGDDPGHTGDASKLYPFPHMNAVLATSGLLLPSLFGYLELSLMPEDDVADVGERFGEILQKRLADASESLLNCEEIPQEYRDGLGQQPLKAVLVGWSYREKRIVGWYYDAAMGRWGARLGAGCLVFPPNDHEALQGIVAPFEQARPTRRNAHELVRQVRSVFSDDFCERFGAGGHITTAAIDREGVDLRIERNAFG